MTPQTNLIELIKADREAGTPGDWKYRPCDHDDWGVVRAGRFLICQARDPEAVDNDFLAECRSAKIDPWGPNARRIARVPEMEQALIDLTAEIERLRETLKLCGSYRYTTMEKGRFAIAALEDKQ